MEYQDQISKINLKKIVPVSIVIFSILILLLFLVGYIPKPAVIILATIMVAVLVIAQAVIILKDKG